MRFLKEPKGVVYVDVPVNDDSPVHFVKAMQRCIGYEPDRVLDSERRIKEPDFGDVWKAFSIKEYKRKYKQCE
jgi:hypothetical protein